MTRQRIARLISGVIAGIGVVATGAGCSGEAATADPVQGTSSVGPAVTTAAAPLRTSDISDIGDALVDERGMTVYAFDADSATVSACVDQCAANWPIVAAPDPLPTSLAGISGQLGVLQRADGYRQLLLNDHPLYTFVQDAAAGDHKGQGKTFAGGQWHVMLATGTPLP